MDALPHVGIDNVRLGATRAAITETLGAPDKCTHDHHDDGERSEIWIYRMLRLELSFDSEHVDRLSHITCYHPYTIVRGFNPIGLSERLLLQKYPHLELDIQVSDDEKYYSDRILDLTFGITGGKVVSVTVFPEYDESGTVVLWPRDPM